MKVGRPQSWKRPKLGIAYFIAWATMFGAANVSGCLAFDVHLLGGPQIMVSHPSSDERLVMFVLFLPAIIAVLWTLGRLPQSRAAVIVFLGVMAAILALHVPLLLDGHTGIAVIVAIAAAKSLLGFVLARGRRFAEICDAYRLRAPPGRAR